MQVAQAISAVSLQPAGDTTTRIQSTSPLEASLFHRLSSAAAAISSDLESLQDLDLIRHAERVQKLNTSITHRLAQLRRAVIELEAAADTRSLPHQAEALLRSATEWRGAVADLGRNYAACTVLVKRRTDRLCLETRDALLVSSPSTPFADFVSQADQHVTEAAEDVTEGLRRTRQLLVEQVERSEQQVALLSSTNAQLSLTQDEFEKQHPLLKLSKRLLRLLASQETWDKLVLYGGLTFFILVCAYIVQKRSKYFVPEFVSSALFAATDRTLGSGGRVIGKVVMHSLHGMVHVASLLAALYQNMMRRAWEIMGGGGGGVGGVKTSLFKGVWGGGGGGGVVQPIAIRSGSSSSPIPSSSSSRGVSIPSITTRSPNIAETADTKSDEEEEDEGSNLVHLDVWRQEHEAARGVASEVALAAAARAAREDDLASEEVYFRESLEKKLRGEDGVLGEVVEEVGRGVEAVKEERVEEEGGGMEEDDDDEEVDDEEEEDLVEEEQEEEEDDNDEEEEEVVDDDEEEVDEEDEDDVGDDNDYPPEDDDDQDDDDQEDEEEEVAEEEEEEPFRPPGRRRLGVVQDEL